MLLFLPYTIQLQQLAPSSPHMHITGLVTDPKHGQSNVRNYVLTNSMEHSHSGEANRCSADREIPFILWNTKCHYHAHKSQINLVYAVPTNLLRSILIYPPIYALVSHVVPYPHVSPPKSHMCHMPSPPHCLDNLTNIR